MAEDLLRGLRATAEVSAALEAGTCGSIFLQGLHDCYRALRWDVGQHLSAERLQMLRHWALGFSSALKMRPLSQEDHAARDDILEDDYELVAHHLPMYVLTKAMCTGTGKALTWYGAL